MSSRDSRRRTRTMLCQPHCGLGCANITIKVQSSRRLTDDNLVAKEQPTFNSESKLRVTNLDSKSCKNLPPKKALERQEKEKKKKYCKSCENQRRHFTPFVVSTDGMLGFEARAFLKRLAKLLAEEWEKPYPTLRGFINARMSIALV